MRIAPNAKCQRVHAHTGHVCLVFYCFNVVFFGNLKVEFSVHSWGINIRNWYKSPFNEQFNCLVRFADAIGDRFSCLAK